MAARRKSTRPILALMTCACAWPSIALDVARMQLPSEFEARTQRIQADGFGGANRGTYRLGEFSGEFTRIESRWAVFDPLVARNRGKSSFTLHGPGFAAPVSAECQMRQGNITIGIVSLDPKKMSYQCTFNSGDYRLVLGQRRPETMRDRLLARAERQGEAFIDGIRVGIRSVHGLQGSKLQSMTPAGYLLEVNDVVIGGVELTDVNPTVFLPRAESPDVTRSVLITALALSVLRDPADSPLGE